MKELDDILNDEEPKPEAEVAPEVEPEPQAMEAEPEAETPKEAEPEAEAKEPEPVTGEDDAPPASKEPGHVPITALLDEREKRQAAEAAAKAAREELARQQQPAPQRPDQFEDPDGAAEFDRQQTENMLLGMKIKQSRVLAEKFHDDFGEVEKAYNELQATDPALWTMLGNVAAQQDVPYEWLYREMKARQTASEVGDLSEYEKKVEERVRQQLAAEAKAEAEAKARSEIPESLADAQSSGGRTTAFSGPTPLESIVG